MLAPDLPVPLSQADAGLNWAPPSPKGLSHASWAQANSSRLPEMSSGQYSILPQPVYNDDKVHVT